ncbi:hypothetical protein EHW67_18875 [Arenibacter aquaticus]|uniref:Uncharacterized protein n=1 Tax=Arenibacter aquaticus TaxID=2489054 RepID=A0A3S0AKG5_9FLAO|nr:hypothetical protein [Arenibacter aquaticus]RTE52249.1 hypothetical protein EHW67_18875 [Arenibacter aquaticus]
MIIVGCKHHQDKDPVNLSPDNKASTLIHGRRDGRTVTKEGELKLDQFTGFRSLLNRADEITCSDSIPFIQIEKNENRHKFYIDLDCWSDGIIYDYSQKNILIIHNDSIEKRLINPWVIRRFHIDELEAVLKKDLTNKGSDPNWSVNPSKLILNISVSENRLEQLPIIFNELAEASERHKLKMDFRIWLADYLPHFIPPEPPIQNKN